MAYSFKKEQTEFNSMFASMKATGQLFANSGGFASSTEIGAMMSNLVIGARRLECWLDDLERRQQVTLLNIIPFDITEAKRIINDLEFQVREALKDDIADRKPNESKSWEEVIKEENNSEAFALGDGYEDFERVRWHLMKQIKPNYTKFKTLAENITRHLTYIEIHLAETETDMEMSGSIYNKMMTAYLQEEWMPEYGSLVYNTKRVVEKGRAIGLADDYILQNELDSLRASYMKGNPPKHLKRLYNTILFMRKSPVEVMIDYRDVLTDDDISNYFTFLFSYRTLKAHIDTLPLKEPLTGEYAKLFTSRTAEKYIELMLPLLSLYGELEHIYQYGILLMAMKDLGLAQLEGKPYKLAKKYFTEKLSNESILQNGEHEMISQMVRDAQNISFCSLEYGETEGTKFKESQIKSYQDVYWRCFTMLSDAGRIVPKDIKIASYLQKPHPLINMDAIMNKLDDKHRMWIDFYHSVLRGETLMFD